MQSCSNWSEAEIPYKQGNLQGIPSFQPCLASERGENPMSDNGLSPYSLRGQTGNFEWESREFAAPIRDNFRGESTGTGPAKPPFTDAARGMMMLHWHIVRSPLLTARAWLIALAICRRPPDNLFLPAAFVDHLTNQGDPNGERSRRRADDRQAAH
jgi:hypothetical protein